jgi:hypothetical protein
MSALPANGWLFRTRASTTAAPRSDQAMAQPDAWRMIRRRAAAAAIAAPIGCHTFRATGITAAYFTNGGALEHAQESARERHEPPSCSTARRSGSLRMN